MTRSQPRVRLFFREHPIIALAVVVVVVLLVCAGAATTLGGLFNANDSPESAAPEPIATETSEPEESDTESSLSTGAVNPEEHLETGDLTEDIDCSTNQPAEQYAALVERILDYEEARLTPGFEADQEAMKLYATDNYIKSHSRSIDPDDPTDLTVTVDRTASTVSCFIASDTRVIVQAWPVFSTHRVNEAGESELVNQFTDPLVHQMGWVLVNNVWFVDSDIR